MESSLAYMILESSSWMSHPFWYGPKDPVCVEADSNRNQKNTAVTATGWMDLPAWVKTSRENIEKQQMSVFPFPFCLNCHQKVPSILIAGPLQTIGWKGALAGEPSSWPFRRLQSQSSGQSGLTTVIVININRVRYIDDAKVREQLGWPRGGRIPISG